MQQKLKERLVGAAVLVAVAVIFIPIILSDAPKTDSISGSNIPERPAKNFNSRIIPVDESNEPIPTANIDANDKNTMEPKASNIDEVIKEVVVEKIDKDKSKSIQISASKQESKMDETQTDVGFSAWIVQLGSFSDEENAQSLNMQLREEGYPAFVEPLKTNGKTSYRVRVGPELKRSDADTLLKKLKDKMKLDGIVVSYP